MSSFQDKLTRCLHVCQDEVTTKYDMNNEKNREPAQKMMNQCANTCVDKHLTLLKSVQSKLEKDIQDIVSKSK
jgi:hypothetical protein